MIPNNAKVTVVVVPRERFSIARRSLESLIANSPPGLNLVYVDGGSPPALRRYLEQAAVWHRFRLLRYDCYLSPNEARNIGFAEVTTPYVVFVDNDIIVTPGWLENLLACARDTGAWLVGPLYCQGDPPHEIIHMAGGEPFLEENSEGRWLYEVHRYVGEPLLHVRHRLRREETRLIEFHTLLAQSEALRRIGPLDEGLMCTREHLDLCMRTARAGGRIYLEPHAVVTNLQPPPVAWSDLPFYLLRWSDEWTRATYRRLAATWGARDGHDVDLRRRIRAYRRQGLPLLHAVVALFGEAVAARFDTVLENLLTAAARRRRRRVLAGRAALAPQSPPAAAV
ncbi:MAG TPA: glycosyltransferase [Burkholderiales bacterium]|nr:glycosyltransferase [Burkholderiales bacterium]